MIKEEIKLYDEPSTYVVTYNSNVQTADEKAKWEKRCIDDLETAKNRCAIGDTIISVNNPTSRMVILGFIENPIDMQRYQGSPCMIRAANPAYHSATGIQYSLAELQWDTLIKAEVKENTNEC